MTIYLELLLALGNIETLFESEEHGGKTIAIGGINESNGLFGEHSDAIDCGLPHETSFVQRVFYQGLQ